MRSSSNTIHAQVIVTLATLFACTACSSAPTTAPTPETTSSAAHPAALAPITEAGLPVEQARLGVPPNAAPPITRRAPAKVVVNLEVQEVTREIADGATYTFWTYGGTVPGPMIRVRRGDFVELHLQNHPNNTMPHNIDLHAVTGPGGGATSTFTAPGHQTQFSFRALNQGVYIYHCATAPVGMHIANGMYGLIVVEPEEGYPAVDKEYYVAQGDFYTTGDYREPGLQQFDMQRGIDENPSYVLFNGRDGALTGDNALTANVGQTVRMFVGNGGPNLTSSFHVIGEIFDHVYQEAGTIANTDVQTTLIPPGGAALVDFRVEVPGTYILVDHALFRTFHKGTLGMLRVTGPEDHVVYSGREVDEAYLGTAAQAVGAPGGAARPVAAAGEATFIGLCATCHQRDGRGLANLFPPLASSDYLMADKARSIEIVLAGRTGPITVNGANFTGAMPPLSNLTDHEIAAVLTYVRANFGNHGDAVTDAEVAAVRARLNTPRPESHP